MFFVPTAVTGKFDILLDGCEYDSPNTKLTCARVRILYDYGRRIRRETSIVGFSRLEKRGMNQRTEEEKKGRRKGKRKIEEDERKDLQKIGEGVESRSH